MIFTSTLDSNGLRTNRRHAASRQAAAPSVLLDCLKVSLSKISAARPTGVLRVKNTTCEGGRRGWIRERSRLRPEKNPGAL